jgi:hypothetical protein
MTEVSPEPTNRKELLEKVFLEFAGVEPLSPDGQAYANDGNGSRNILAELDHLRDPSELDAAIELSRKNYMNIVLTRPTIVIRKVRKDFLHVAELDYETTVIKKLAAYTDSDGTPQTADQPMFPRAMCMSHILHSFRLIRL